LFEQAVRAVSETANFTRIAGNQEAGLILLCDHARNALPLEYGSLGLPATEFERHIAYDIGAEGVTTRLAQRLGATALMTCYSRLLIDPNRGLDDPTLIMQLSDGAVIPGNRDIDCTERQRRIDRYYLPYHTAITAEIDALISMGVRPILVSIHSFTPFWKAFARPWHAGILWDRDGRLPHLLLEGLLRDTALVVGDNEPYHGALEGDTLNTHCTRRGLAHALVEIRQDLIASQSGVDEWAERLALILEPVMKDPVLRLEASVAG
jgi:predicted N-formylglutamate amidohydrolase